MANAAPDAPASREQASWEANIASSCQLLEPSYLSVATAAFQTGLIAFDMMGAVTRKNLIVTKKEQALTLVTTLYLKMLSRPTEASNVMEKFSKILGKEAALDSLREELGSYRTRTRLFCAVWKFAQPGNLHDLAISFTRNLYF